MGRTIPPHNNNNHIIFFTHHPFLSFSFLAATLAATIVIIAAMCGVKSPKKPSPSSTPSDHHLNNTEENDLNSESPQIIITKPENQRNETLSNNNESLPLPPAMLQKNVSSSVDMKKYSLERRSSFNLSFKKVPRSFTKAKSDDFKTEESVWMKTIILGEKCVPDEEESSVIYEGKGKRISAYHPRSSSSLSIISKQLSSIDLDSLPHDDEDDDDRDSQDQQTNQQHV